jgi:hypothetical protein
MTTKQITPSEPTGIRLIEVRIWKNSEVIEHRWFESVDQFWEIIYHESGGRISKYTTHVYEPYEYNTIYEVYLDA